MNARTGGSIGRPLRTALVAVSVLALAVSVAGCGALGTSADETYEEPSTMQYAEPEIGESRSADAAIDTEASAPLPEAGSGADASTVAPEDRLVIRTAGVRIDVDDVEASVDELRAAADARGGMVVDVQLSTDESVPVYRYEALGSLADGAALSGWVTVRVPSEGYDEFLADVRGLGDVIRQSESEQDVTQESIDLNARLQNLQAQELRLREFFDRAESVEDLLAIEQELTRVRADIDGLEGRIAYLERQAAMSTVTVELLGPVPVVRPATEDWGFVQAITDGVRGAAGVVRFGIAFVLATSPLWILGLIAFFVVRTIFKRRSRSRATSTEGAPPASEHIDGGSGS